MPRTIFCETHFDRFSRRCPDDFADELSDDRDAPSEARKLQRLHHLEIVIVAADAIENRYQKNRAESVHRILQHAGILFSRSPDTTLQVADLLGNVIPEPEEFLAPRATSGLKANRIAAAMEQSVDHTNCQWSRRRCSERSDTIHAQTPPLDSRST